MMPPKPLPVRPVVTVRVPYMAAPAGAPPYVTEALRPHLDGKGARIVLHFGDVRVPASWFLGDFMAAVQLCRRRAATMRLCGVSPPMMNLMRVSGLAEEFAIHETEAEAREAFAAEEPQP